MSRVSDPTRLTYSGVHQRIRKERGSASDHPCHNCGGPAHEWAFKESSGFSFDWADYAPLCRSCHRTHDGGRTWCQRHDQSRIKKASRGWLCVQCNRERSLARLALMQQARTILGLGLREYVRTHGQSAITARTIIERNGP